MAEKKIIELFVSDDYSFNVMEDEKGKKVGKLVNLKTNKLLADDLYQKIMPEDVSNLLNVAKVIISAAWQDGKILPSERRTFEKAFENVDFTRKQKKEIEKEFAKPTPIEKLIKKITSREEKLLILETSLLLVIADNEFHPKERKFIEYLVKEFGLDSADFALLYQILPQSVKKYIVKEKIHETLKIREDDIITLDKFAKEKKVGDINHEKVYYHFVRNWNNRSIRYQRGISV